MIKTLIFDFGDVFINLDKEGAIKNALELFKLDEFPKELIAVNCLYEQGLISTEEFIEFYLNNFPHLSDENIYDAWNYIIKDFPRYRLTFLKELSEKKDYTLILLSNTNTLHINWIKEHISFYEEFKSCFDQFYLSHEIYLRKPDVAIFEFVIQANNLIPQECLFIDDTKENTDAASKLGIHIWNINEKEEDVTTLFETHKSLF